MSNQYTRKMECEQCTRARRSSRLDSRVTAREIEMGLLVPREDARGWRRARLDEDIGEDTYSSQRIERPYTRTRQYIEGPILSFKPRNGKRPARWYSNICSKPISGS